MRALGRTEEIGGGGRLSSSGVCERGKSRGDAGGGRDSEDHKKVKKKERKGSECQGGGSFGYFVLPSLFPQLWSDAID